MRWPFFSNGDDNKLTETKKKKRPLKSNSMNYNDKHD